MCRTTDEMTAENGQKAPSAFVCVSTVVTRRDFSSISTCFALHVDVIAARVKHIIYDCSHP